MSATAGWHGIYELSNNVNTAMTASYSTNKLLTASISLQYSFSHNSSDEKNEPLPDYWPSRSTWSS